MQFPWVTFAFLLSTKLFALNETGIPDSQVEDSNFHMLAYAQTELILPGVGLALQYDNKISSVGFQLDAGIFYLYLGEFGHGYAEKYAASLVLFNKKHNFFGTLGVGVCGNTLARFFFFMVPVGCYWKTATSSFVQVGLDIVMSEGEQDFALFPNFRYGTYF